METKTNTKQAAKRKHFNGRVLWRDVPHLYYALNAARQRIYANA